MDMKKLLKQLSKIESKQVLNESTVDECGESPIEPMNTQPGSPVSVSVNISATGSENVQDLLDLIKNAGLQSTDTQPDEKMPLRHDIDAFKTIVWDNDRDDDSEDEFETEDEFEEEFANEPDETYQDSNYMTHTLSGGINKQKKSYKPSAKGDNPMNADMYESIKQRLYKKLKSY